MESYDDGLRAPCRGGAMQLAVPEPTNNVRGIVSRITRALRKRQIFIATLPIAEFPPRLFVATAALLIVATGAKAQDAATYRSREIETKNIFQVSMIAISRSSTASLLDLDICLSTAVHFFIRPLPGTPR